MNIRFLYAENQDFPDIWELLNDICPDRASVVSPSSPSLPGIFAAYRLLLRALNDFCGLENIPKISRTANGKPYFPDHPELFFSISHTKTHSACAVSNSNIGIDIESIRKVPQELFKRITARDEEEIFSKEQDGFFKLWTLKESFIKYCGGEGISSYRDMAFTIEKECIRLNNRTENFKIFSDIPGCIASVCSEYNIMNLSPEKIEIYLF